MGRMAVIAAASLAAAFLLSGVGPVTMAATQKAAERTAPGMPPPPDPVAADIAGRYLVKGDAKGAVVIIDITLLGGGAYRVTAEGWDGVGLSDGKRYWGVYRYHDGVAPPAGVAASGTHLGSLGADGSIRIHGESADGPGRSFDAVWKPDLARPPNGRRGSSAPGFQHPVWPPDTPPIQVTPPEQPPIKVVPPEAPREGLPKLGDYVYVEELPEALTKVPPAYPPDAREAKVEGTVMVQALVGKDGLVKDARVVKSIPALDQAAVESVRQWRFKPARMKGEPVAVWVAVPVRFALH